MKSLTGFEEREETRRSETDQDKVKRYRAAAEEFDINPDHIYHPTQTEDISVSEAFPESKTTYVNEDIEAVRNLQTHGYHARQANPEEYVLEDRADLIIFTNQIFDIQNSVENNLEEDGWIIANDYHNAASTLNNMEGYQLRGVAPVTHENHPNIETREPYIDTQNLDLYWERITNEQEYRRWRPRLHENKRQLIDEKQGRNADLFEGLKEIKRDKIQSRIEELKILDEEEHEDRIKDLTEELKDPEITGPRKKGSLDALYIFQKQI